MSAAHRFTDTTSIRMVWPFLVPATRHGRDLSAVAARFGLTRAQLENRETRVPTRLIAEILREAIECSGERDLGLLAARWVDATHFGVCEYLPRARATLRAAIEDTNRYMPLMVGGFGHALERHGAHVIARMWFSPDLEMHEAAYEFAVAAGVLRARRIARDETLAPVEIHFMHARPPSTERHEALFRCPIHFGCESTQVVMRADSLELQMPAAEPALAELLVQQAETMLENLPRGDLRSRVLALLGGEVALREASVKHVARRVGVSVRNLSRRLADEGTTYRELVDRVRKQAALSDLSRGTKSITEIADALGFSSSQSFHRAFRRWTGTTADRHRRRLREQRQHDSA